MSSPTRIASIALSAVIFSASIAAAQTPPLRIGVLTDESGPYADSAGQGSIAAARMAVEDFGGEVLGRKIEIVHADTLNKPDVAAGIARRWFEVDNVSAVVDLPVTPIAFAVQALAKEKNRTVMITAAATADLTQKRCSAVSSHWADDSHALAAGTAKAISETGAKTWYFLSVDYSFGAALQHDATEVIEANGGKVVGFAKHPINNPDFSSLVLQAQASGAEKIGLASVGGDLVNEIKQGAEFGVGRDGKQSMVGFLVYIQDIHALGLDVARNLNVTSGFYWDQSDSARAFAKRFQAERKMAPSRDHAQIYVATRHYLEAVKAVGADEAVAVNKAMRAAPIDYFGKPASMRADGRVIYDLTLYRVKTAAESKGPWDYYAKVRDIPAAEAFQPLNKAVCGDL